MMREKKKSYSDWASSLATLIDETVSKQAVFTRMSDTWVATVKKLLQEVLAQQTTQKVKHELFQFFGNVWLQDSTTLHLPDVLSSIFKGSVSRGRQKSVAKLNVVINLLSGQCPIMEWMSFTVNEQSLATRELNLLKKGDLLIRDLGYFALPAFAALTRKGIYFLSRLKYGIALNDIKSGEPVNLIKLLKGKTYIDKEFLCGKDQNVKVRLVAIKLSEEQASERKRKARKDRDKRLNHSDSFYQLLGYVIFITNVDKEVWNYKQVAEAYRVRWNIEILFKSWKSGLDLKNIMPDAKKKTHRIEGFLYLILLYITWFTHLIYAPLKWAKELKNKKLSILKAVKYLLSNVDDWLTRKLDQKMKRKIIYYCCYDSRRDRLNAVEYLETYGRF